MMSEDRPTASPYQPLNGHTPAVRAQLITALSVSIVVRRAAPVELRPALAKAERRFVIQHEIERAGLWVRMKLLHKPPVLGFDANSQRVGRELHHQIAAANLTRARQARDTGGGGRPRSLRQRAVVRERLRLAVYDGRDAQTHGHGADRRHNDLHRLPRDSNRGLLRS